MTKMVILQEEKKGKYEKWDKDEYHLATEVWVINSKKQILIQQRSEKMPATSWDMGSYNWKGSIW